MSGARLVFRITKRLSFGTAVARSRAMATTANCRVEAFAAFITLRMHTPFISTKGNADFLHPLTNAAADNKKSAACDIFQLDIEEKKSNPNPNCSHSKS